MTIELTPPLISQTLLEDLARVGPKYSRWTPEAYFELDGNYLVEYARGRLEVLPMPAIAHQRIARRLFNALEAWVKSSGARGEPFFAGTRVKVGADRFREPDVLYVPPDGLALIRDEYVERVELAMEVVSESNRDHDLMTKREEYAQADINEYWIVDPQEGLIAVLALQSGRYVLSRECRRGERAASACLSGFTVDVQEILGSP